MQIFEHLLYIYHALQAANNSSANWTVDAQADLQHKLFHFLFSFFGKAFEQAAASTSSRTLHDSFDTFSKFSIPIVSIAIP